MLPLPISAQSQKAGHSLKSMHVSRAERASTSRGSRSSRALAEADGALDKEALVLAVWGERVHHPLRHDSRLHAAVRELRPRIEDDPRAPARVVTTEQGYALGGTVRLLRS